MLIEHDGKQYMKLGNRLIEVSSFSAEGKPVIKCSSEQTPNANGGMDCTITVPCLRLANKQNKLGE